MANKSVANRIETLEEQILVNVEDRIKAEITAELEWWTRLLCPNGETIPPRPKTRHVTLEIIVAGTVEQEGEQQ